TKDAVKETATGALQGAAVGNAAGAVVGGLKGLGQAALKSKRGRKVLLTIVALALLPGLTSVVAQAAATAVITGAVLAQDDAAEDTENATQGPQCLIGTEGGEGVVI